MNVADGIPPADLATMRDTVRRMIGPGAQPPTGEDLDLLTSALRGHIELIIPMVDQAARKLPQYYPLRDGGLVAVWSARKKLSATVDPGPGGLAAHAVELAYALDFLCDRYESLRSPAPA
ncbi:DUF6415 family natural product biosynthesis protein [Streptomyces sp. JB150]|uniref:DUF6415 family natural product biosynthesis protein n=1 Tax=Streptomyces sp. JB150 TaxID=2714844 RepID=UPI001409B06A|nr:DUF6415 family natural product biosynthesis protein [Streptomyces sp. JB150]QIJ62531.1 hypothetical protein G7Z13_11145 [Streptomyces sp. JB150]